MNPSAAESRLEAGEECRCDAASDRAAAVTLESLQHIDGTGPGLHGLHFRGAGVAGHECPASGP